MLSSCFYERSSGSWSLYAYEVDLKPEIIKKFSKNRKIVRFEYYDSFTKKYCGDVKLKLKNNGTFFCITNPVKKIVVIQIGSKAVGLTMKVY
jgi:hypothetical protein